MTIFTDTYIPYDFEDKQKCLKHVEQRCQGIKKALRRIEKDNEHLRIRCPLSGDYIEVTGSMDEINWLHAELTKRKWYRTN